MFNTFLFTVAKHVMLSPVYLIYGVFAAGRSFFRLFPALRRLRAAMQDTITCANGHRTPVAGRFTCASCRAVFHGWVGRCQLCGAGASWTPCIVCGVSVPLPWEVRS